MNIKKSKILASGPAFAGVRVFYYESVKAAKIALKDHISAGVFSFLEFRKAII